MENQSLRQERRDFFRLNSTTPLEYKTYDAGQAPAPVKAKARNISQSGILFQTEKNPPALSSLIWLSLDIRTLRICQEIEKRALIANHGLVGRVVRVEEDENSNAYDIGVCFVTKDQKDIPGVAQVLSNLSTGL